MPTPPFRTGTRVSEMKIAFIYNSGGIGDYINWTSAIRCAIRTSPHIRGYVITPPHFADLARLWLEGYDSRFEVRVERVSDYGTLPYIQDCALIAPTRDQYASANSHGLFELGFIYYMQIDRVPEGWGALPEIRGDEADVTRFNLPERYVVLTPNATNANRRLSAPCLNEVKDFFLREGLTPVYLGKRDLIGDPGYEGIASEGLDLRGVLDLRDLTSLREAAVIMARARLNFGLDNGLMHLASCSKAPCLWIFTTVDPRLRLMERASAVTTVVTPAPNFECRFCQSRMRYVIGHDFKNCLYGDYACVTTLTAEKLIGAIKQTLARTP